ncbi:hypothetical protein JCGZ_07293 [Jatropha curcas]|uniref:CRM domain-containing protein n=1 Tax=Jatropha curcas TaxID=180498 RepID=A0A067KC88_JATCU|nr:CRS2-associated factor 1, chloroplastic [Jatropha curcas]KDP33722.1 hypothetical protein JCGZ_07293 [Jatropha curcas]
MALKLFPVQFPIFSPLLNPNPIQNPSQRPLFEVHFSRWNNANARKFNEQRRAQKEIEDDIRRQRRFDSATNIVQNYDSATKTTSTETFKSIGTPSSPSTPSIPGRKSKYSKPKTHPAFRRVSTRITQPKDDESPIERNANIKLSEDGLSYVVNGAPFEFKYSYTESPKVKPLKLREPPFSPFGPTTMSRPWIGLPPKTPKKKRLREFDSFKLPPPDKKGVKPVQSPGPFLPGSGPRYVYTREEIQGEPLTRDEVKDLIKGCLKTKRQLNMGRDGLTHNMLDNIHAHWKRRRVCKIKCKGVCTVDMDNVCQQLEEKTGGKVIHRKAGLVYLFRGRNYNYRTRPRFPLMLWKPVTPVYPRLIQRAPEGLTVEEAAEMRKKGRDLIPIRKLARNGVFYNLAHEVRLAFQVCELVRINCQAIVRSDCRKIGAKLKDLVPCVLLSFEDEHILMWRGRDWKPFLTEPVNDCKEGKGLNATIAASIAPIVEDQKAEMVSIKEVINVQNMGTAAAGCEEQTEDQSTFHIGGPAAVDASSTTREMNESNPTSDNASSSSVNVCETIRDTFGSEAAAGYEEQTEGQSPFHVDGPAAADASSTTREMSESNTTLDDAGSSAVIGSETISNVFGSEAALNNLSRANEMSAAISVESDTVLESVGSTGKLQDALVDSSDVAEQENLSALCVDGVLQLLKQAVESGSAVILEDANLDADNVYEKAVAFAQSAPRGPVFRIQKPRKVWIRKSDEEQESKDLEAKEVTTISHTEKSKKKKSFKLPRNERSHEQSMDSAPLGSLGIDELAKLLA